MQNTTIDTVYKGYCLQALANTRGNGVVVITNGDCFESSAENLVTEILRTIFSVYDWIPQSAFEDLFPKRYQYELICQITSS